MVDYGKYWIDKAKFLNSIGSYDGEVRFVEGVNYAVNVACSCQTSGLVKVVVQGANDAYVISVGIYLAALA